MGRARASSRRSSPSSDRLTSGSTISLRGAARRHAPHTTNDVVAWIPERSVLFAGDLLFNGGTPFVLDGLGGGLARRLEHLRAFGARTIVPGHGDVCGPEQIDRVADYLRFVQHAPRPAKPRACAAGAARQTDLGRFAELTDAERIVGNLYRAYAELDGAAPGAPIDIFGALRTWSPTTAAVRCAACCESCWVRSRPSPGAHSTPTGARGASGRERRRPALCQ